MYGLLGRHLAHSYSPAVHRLLGNPDYRLFEREPEAVEAFLRHGPWQGLNVTMPYKRQAAACCDDLSPLAKALGSVNTLVRRRDGSIYGDNTDVFGFVAMAKTLPVDYAGQTALVLGSGGASAAACYGLSALGANPVVISRTGPNNYANLARHEDAAVVVNATPVGMYPHNGDSPLDLTRLPNLAAVLDLIYNPARTALLLQAQALGLAWAGGLTMLVGQAARSCQLFTGKPVEGLEAIRRAVAWEKENLILIGMPGCGKTTVGQALAKALGRPFADTDRQIARAAGCTVAALIRQGGEDRFRAWETRALRRACAGSGQVIATGGGCVTRPENRDILRQNGRVIWLQRALHRLPRAGRPLSRDLAALEQVRRPLYAGFSQYTVDNNATVAETVQQILEVMDR